MGEIIRVIKDINQEIKKQITHSQRFFVLEYLCLIVVYVAYAYLIITTKHTVIIIICLQVLFFYTVFKIYFLHKVMLLTDKYFTRENKVLQDVKKHLIEVNEDLKRSKIKLEKALKKKERRKRK